MLLCAMTSSAQDVIVMKDGNPILANVLEVNTDHVKYKKHTNQKGPSYTIAITDILSLTYANGIKENFENVATMPTPNRSGHQEQINETQIDGNNDAPIFMEHISDARNAEIIRQYSTIYQPTKRIKPSNVQASRCFIFCGIKSKSNISNNEIEMTIEARNEYTIEGNSYPHRFYLIKLMNKTDKVMYVDKGCCFRISSDGSSYTYYDPSAQTTFSNGSNIGASMNAGTVASALGIGGIASQLVSGLNVGGSSHQTVSTTYNPQRIIAIPPHSFRYLTEAKFVKTMGEYKRVEQAEEFLFMSVPIEQMGFSKGTLRNGQICLFSENDLPWSRKYVITYSTSEMFNTYSCLQCEFYIKEIIGSSKPRNTTWMKSWRKQDGESILLNGKWNKYISSLDNHCIVGFTMFDGKEESGTGTVIGLK